MEDVVIQRIKKFREVLKVSLPKFSETIGVEYRTVNQYMNGERKPSLRFICSILCAYEDLSSEWLLRGEGHMMKTESGGLGHTRGIMSSDGPENKNDFFEFANSIIKQNNQLIEQNNRLLRMMEAWSDGGEKNVAV